MKKLMRDVLDKLYYNTWRKSEHKILGTAGLILENLYTVLS